VVLVFSGSVVLLFGTSALYHGRRWGPAGWARMRRLDHAAIFALIAGGYTPLFGLVPNGGGHGALLAIWCGAGLGVAKVLLWSKAPTWISTLLYVGLGWSVTSEVAERTAAVGRGAIALLVAAGALYSVGAVIYARRRPDPWPRVFGYHEVFHALVVLASALLFAHVVCVMRATGGL
jgi:hemolysin III